MAKGEMGGGGRKGWMKGVESKDKENFIESSCSVFTIPQGSKEALCIFLSTHLLGSIWRPLLDTDSCMGFCPWPVYATVEYSL